MTLTVLVIGGGITGISTSEYLRREGVKVKLIDKFIIASAKAGLSDIAWV